MTTQQGRSTVRPVFEDFKPTSQWQQDDDSHILLIYLPGFTKEQLRVSTENQDVIRVRGERLVAGNKWNRFLEDYEVPRNSDMNSVRAKFQDGTLTITVRKKNVDIPHQAPPSKTPAADAPKQPTPHKGHHESPPELDKRGDLGTKQGQPDVSRDARQGSPFRNVGQVLPPRDNERKESSELKEAFSAPGTDDATKKKVEKDESSESKELPSDETTKKKKLKTADRAPDTSKTKESDEGSKEKQAMHSTGADYGIFTVEKYKKAVKGLSELNDERKLLVNMGVAVLIVMAVTAYVTYKVTSGKDQN